MAEAIRAGDRLRGVRSLLNMTQEEMASYLKIKFVRYRNVENKSVRMAEDEFEASCSVFSEFTHFLAYGGPIKLDELRNSDNQLVKVALANIEAGRIPEGVGIEGAID